MILLGTALEKVFLADEPLPLDEENEFLLRFTNQVGSCGALLGLGGIYLGEVTVEEADLWEFIGEAILFFDKSDFGPIEDPP